MENLSEDRIIKDRLEKLEKLRKLKIDPYPNRWEKDRTIIYDAITAYDDSNESANSKQLCISGRIIAKRAMGKIIFFDIKDQSGKIQLHYKEEESEINKDFLDLIDIGDIVGVEGHLFRTRRGELTLDLHDIVILTKAIRPLPDKWSGLKDNEIRYRQRYLDLISNEESLEIAVKRSKAISSVRNFMNNRGFLEVETPILVDIPAGGRAIPFSTYHESLEKDLFLRIATELHLKKLIVGGIEKVYEIGRLFRNEGIDHDHNPEFTTMESYEAYEDYNTVMRMVEDLVSYVSIEVNGTTKINISDDLTIDLAPPWQRLDLRKAIIDNTGIDFLKFKNNNDLANEMKNKGFVADQNEAWGILLDRLISQGVEPKLIKPTFLLDYPIEMSPLAKLKPGSKDVVERFEAFVLGHELANAFTELNDPIDQRNRFLEQEKQRKNLGDKEADRLDEDFLISIEHGMPPTGGLGIGIDRLIMLITAQDQIREVLLFPQLRSKK
ncbi:MAG: lysine--tRNA ligase [Chloroflexi bacterium]|nr:lysine--tRNA ligase [Chloroflexota bacterium]